VLFSAAIQQSEKQKLRKQKAEISIPKQKALYQKQKLGK
jgi:hypothetical protein